METIDVHTIYITGLSNGSYTGVTIDGKECILPEAEAPQDQSRLRPGDTVQVAVLVDQDPLIVTTFNDAIISTLLTGLIPEIREGIVQIKDIARAPGVRAKVSVVTTFPGKDPAGICVGRGANRVKAINKLLGRERVDFINWAEDDLTYAKNALAPAKVKKIVMNKKKTKIIAEVPRHLMAASVGAGGLNCRLASAIVGTDILIVDKIKEPKKNSGEEPEVTA